MRETWIVTEDIKDKFNGWRVRHNEAVKNPAGFEVAIMGLLLGLESYRVEHALHYASNVGDDGVLSDGVADIAEGVRTLLNGEIGRLDAGTIDGYLVAVLRECGRDL